MYPLYAVLLCALLADAAPDKQTVLVTGATGRTGKETYLALKKAGLSVRALVRNATKARSVLGCQSCDEQEGIFIGDITSTSTLQPAMQGVDTLVITVGPVIKCKYGFVGCDYLPGGSPKEVVWEGLKTQVKAFANTSGRPLKERQVVLMSSGLTTKPDNFLDKIGNGYVTFYSLNAEAFLMSSGLPFTIVQACGLSDGEAGKSKLVVAHDDNINEMSTVSRGDVARVLAAAAAAPATSKGLRFNLCAAWFGKATQNPTELFQEAMYDWDPRKQASSALLV
eukprot:gb/GFBE01044850.1/.p1 GENE.gb/GFBE01044850.1/~~gb/GFBE01044850.1/.p1  ORF type:complete len:281 (+),score=68.10 gb/GFBE01044850.1/:1-843(+)